MLKKLSEEIYKIPYLPGNVLEDFAEESTKAFAGLLEKAELRQLEDFHSLLPLREFMIDFKDIPTNSPQGTKATFTFGILLK